MNLRRAVTGLGMVAMFGSGASCSSAPTTSVVRGTVQQDTFEHAVTAIVVSSKAGASRVAVGADGKFELVLDEGHRYGFALDDGATVPLVLDGAHGRYATDVEVTSGGAEVDLGLVRYFAGDLTMRIIVPGMSVPADSCVDGSFESGEPCISGAAESVCADDEEEDDDDDDHECVDGIDPATNLECDGGPAANGDDDDEGDYAFVQGAVAVPQLGLEDELGCDDDDDDEEDDD
jgi:hypothetical protein